MLFQSATAFAKNFRVTTNHMVCIEVAEGRIKRWDREQIDGESRWWSVEPDTMETLHKIRIVRRAS